MRSRCAGKLIFVCWGLVGMLWGGTFSVQAAEKVDLLLNWIPVGYHVGFFAAKEKGYFAQEGIDITIERGKGSGATAKRVGLGSSMVGLADAGAVVKARAQGIRTKLIGAFFERSPMAIYVLKGSGIKEPKDLVGRSIAAPLASASRVVFPAFAQANGFSPDAVKWITIPPAAQVPTLVTKKADGIASFLTSRPSYEKAAKASGQEIRLIYYADNGLDFYGLTLIGGDDRIRANPKLMKRFLKAAYQGIRWSAEDPADAMPLLIKNHPALNQELASKTWDLARELIITPFSKKHGFGYMDRAKVNLTQEIISKYEDVKKPVTTDELYTNDLLPGIFPAQ